MGPEARLVDRVARGLGVLLDGQGLDAQPPRRRRVALEAIFWGSGEVNSQHAACVHDSQ